MGGIGGWARSTPDAPALISSPKNALTFGDLDRRQQALRAALHDGDVRSGDRIAIFSRNRPEVIEVASAALRAGVIPVPINPLLTEPEITYVLEDSEARWLFTDGRAELLPSLERVVVFGDAYERSLTEGAGVKLADHVLGRPMHYTSGTTSRPKGVHTSPQPEEEAAAFSDMFRETWALGPDDRHLVCSPLAHSAPLRFSIRTLETGGAVIVQEKFDPETTLAAIELYGITTTFMVPTHLERIIALGSKVRHYDLSSIRVLAHAGAPIREDVKRDVIDLFPRGSVWEFYGSTEGQATRISTDEWLRKPGSVGQAYPGTRIYVMSEDFEPVPPGEVGQVWVLDEAAGGFEYWGDPEKTAAAWRDGAFTVGDLGYLDEDGYLYLVGRVDDTIITGGVNVYPAEVEAALCEHPDVTDAMVYGAPSDEWGEEVRAHIVLAPGASVDTEALREWARGRLAAFKIPKRFGTVEEIPRTPTGKKKRPQSTRPQSDND
jgi:acyl-CoA synthetase (AMP-forming)/AMP-acid ligase II